MVRGVDQGKVMPSRHARANMPVPLIALIRFLRKAEARYRSNDTPAGFGFVIAILFALAATGCASAPTAVKMESKSVARELGFPKCSVSVPLSQQEVIQGAKRMGNPNPESDPQWIRVSASMQPGDHWRLVDCLSAQRSMRIGDPYYYALFRGSKVAGEFHFIIVN